MAFYPFCFHRIQPIFQKTGQGFFVRVHSPCRRLPYFPTAVYSPDELFQFILHGGSSFLLQ
jgi:hypothetical protein